MREQHIFRSPAILAVLMFIGLKHLTGSILAGVVTGVVLLAAAYLIDNLTGNGL